MYSEARGRLYRGFPCISVSFQRQFRRYLYESELRFIRWNTEVVKYVAARVSGIMIHLYVNQVGSRGDKDKAFLLR